MVKKVVDIVDEDDNIAKIDIMSLEHKERRRIEDLYKIMADIEANFDYYAAGTNHLVVARKNASGELHLRGLSAIFKWCVCYIVDTFAEEDIPMSKLYYLPMILMRKALYEENQ